MSEYRRIDKKNQSSLKKIIIHPQQYLSAIKKQERDDGVTPDHFVFGSVVDIMLTGTKDEFEENFVKIPDETKCSDAVKVIIDDVFKTAIWIAERDKDIIQILNEYKDDILFFARGSKYRDNYKDETLITTVVKEGNAYFELLKTTVGKTPITETEYAKAVNCMMALKADKFTQRYCKKEKGIEFLDKFIIEFEANGVEVKGELDRVVINHNLKLITPIDFKTTSMPIYSFNSEFWKYRYDFQAATYLHGLYLHPKIVSLLQEGYTINDFKYVVIEKEIIHNPMVFNVPASVIEIGLNGGERSSYKVEGLNQAIQRFKFAEENSAWDYPMEYYQRGEIDIRV